MKTTLPLPTASAARKSASIPQSSETSAADQTEFRWIEFCPSWEDAKALEEAAKNARMTVTDLCRTTIEKEISAKASKSKILPVSGVPSGNRWPFKVALQTWFKVRDEAARHGITIEQWAHAVIARAIHPPVTPAKGSKAGAKAGAANNPSPDEIVIFHRVAKGHRKVLIHFGLSDVALNRIKNLAARRAKSPEDYLSDAMLERIAEDSCPPKNRKPAGFDLAGYLDHPGDKFGVTATDDQFRAWSRAFKASPFETMREWAAAVLDAASVVEITESKRGGSDLLRHDG